MPARYLNERLARRAAFGAHASLLAAGGTAAPGGRIMPKLRGLMSGRAAKIGHLSADPETLEFVCSKDFARLASARHLLPRSFPATKIWPLTWTKHGHGRRLLEESLSEYRAKYAAYYVVAQPQATPSAGNPNPVIVLVPDSAASHSRSQDHGEAGRRILRKCHQRHARRRNPIGRYIGLDEREAVSESNIGRSEKRKIAPYAEAKKPLAGRIALSRAARGASCGNR